jgi:Flp pilus assembly protein TadD
MQATVSRILTVLALALSASVPTALCQNPYYASTSEIVPIINVGANLQVAQFARLDFAQMMLDQQNHKPTQTQLDHQKALIDAGTVSALDLAAPPKAVSEFNQGSALIRGQHSTDAIAHLQKAIAAYPQFLSAHNQLGLAYLDADDVARARVEFENAANLDSRFARSYLNLGRLALSQNDFATAAFNLEKASSMLSADPAILTSLAYAQNANHDYHRAIETVARVHAVQHKGMGIAHYVAALAAVSLNNYPLAESEFGVFLMEEPNHPLAAVARQNIEILQRKQKQLPPSKTSRYLSAMQEAQFM